MLGIVPDFICHKFSIDSKFKPMVQRRRKLGEKKKEVVDQEVEKLRSLGHIREIQYPTWLANVVLVQKNNGK